MSFDLKKLKKNETLLQHSSFEVHLDYQSGDKRYGDSRRKDIFHENEYKGYKTNTPK